MRFTNDTFIAGPIFRQDCLHGLSIPKSALPTPVALLLPQNWDCRSPGAWVIWFCCSSAQPSYHTRTDTAATRGWVACLFVRLFRQIERNRPIDLLFHLIMHSLVDSYRCPDRGSNPQPCCFGTMPGLGGGLKAFMVCEQDGRLLRETVPTLAPGSLHQLPVSPRLAEGELQHHEPHLRCEKGP